ncbi:MAG TPA: prephenate dehydrogenase [Mycobacteriales bacterium]|nr:prephenate dehydrogenase [Mycobacteriales bacterium]
MARSSGGDPAPAGGGRLLVVGTGLIGTSVGLAARAAGYDVVLANRDPERLAVAVQVGAGEPWDGSSTVDVAVVGLPPAIVAREIARLHGLGVARTITHVASVQLQPQLEVEALIGAWGGFVGSHPVAGRERSGPHHASADLFQDRPWVVCPTPSSDAVSVDAVTALARACGARVSQLAAADHDALLARLSHVPQLVASALAAALVGIEPERVNLAGSGLRDTSRLADSDPALWAEIVSANPGGVAAALDAVLEPLVALREVLASGESPGPAVSGLLERGRAGRQLLAGKHGQAAVRWASVTVVVPDEPGALARLLADAAAGGVNVEDIRVDHSPGLPVGLIDLDVAPGRADQLATALEERGWRATGAEPAD